MGGWVGAWVVFYTRNPPVYSRASPRLDQSTCNWCFCPLERRSLAGIAVTGICSLGNPVTDPRGMVGSIRENSFLLFAHFPLNFSFSFSKEPLIFADIGCYDNVFFTVYTRQPQHFNNLVLK